MYMDCDPHMRGYGFLVFPCKASLAGLAAWFSVFIINVILISLLIYPVPHVSDSPSFPSLSHLFMPPLLPRKTGRSRSSSPFSGPGGLTTAKCEILVWILPHGEGLSVAPRERDLAPSGSREYFWREV